MVSETGINGCSFWRTSRVVGSRAKAFGSRAGWLGVGSWTRVEGIWAGELGNRAGVWGR
jgi:hypothetical protein